MYELIDDTASCNQLVVSTIAINFLQPLVGFWSNHLNLENFTLPTIKQFCGFEFESKIEKKLNLNSNLNPNRYFFKNLNRKKFESKFFKKFELEFKSKLLVALDPNLNRYLHLSV